MKFKLNPCFLALTAGVIITLGLTPATTFAQGTAFTYQGRLNDGANPANGLYDLTFALYETIQPPGNLIAGPLTNSATAISNGLFTVTLDFGSQFDGTARWLEIGVQTNGGGAFTTLAPRQAVAPTPYAITAGKVVSGGLADGTYGGALNLTNALNQIIGTFTGDGSGLSSVNAYSVNGLTADNLWKVGGNAGANPTNGAFLGTTDNLPLEFEVNTNRALRLEYSYDDNFGSVAPNVIGGCSGNVVSNGYTGALIAGGGNLLYPNRVGGNYTSVLGGLGNTAIGNFSTTLGGFNQALGGESTALGYSTIASGQFSTTLGTSTRASGYVSTAFGYSTVASGDFSTAFGFDTTASGTASIALGDSTTASGDDSTALGYKTTASGDKSIAVGDHSTASGTCSLALGYYNNATSFGSIALGSGSWARHPNTYVWTDGTISFQSGAANQYLVWASGGVGINTATPPPYGLQVDVGGLAVTGASSPNYQGRGVFIERQSTYGAVYAFDYGSSHTMPLCLNSPGGNVGVGTTTPAHLFQVGNAYCDGNTWAPSSDRNIKAGFQRVDAQAMLAKVAALPITNWHYTNDVATPHVGPMAQDFYAAFNVGADDKHITTTDESGVALAAIQGLNQKFEEQRAENAELKQQVAELKQLVQTLVTKR